MDGASLAKPFFILSKDSVAFNPQLLLYHEWAQLNRIMLWGKENKSKAEKNEELNKNARLSPVKACSRSRTSVRSLTFI